jgi:[ribosomal protein S5]-alanine N-acetyltransferase
MRPLHGQRTGRTLRRGRITGMQKTLHQASRVLPRAPQETDEREFTALARSSRRFLGGWMAPPSTGAAFGAYLRRSSGDIFEALLLIRREDGAVLGAVNLSEIVRGLFQNAYLS